MNLEGGGRATGSTGLRGAVLGALALVFQALGSKAHKDMIFDDDDLGRRRPGDEILLVSFLSVFILGMCYGAWLIHRMCGAVGWTSSTTTKRTVVMQSQVTYTWWTETPRFKLQYNDGSNRID